MTCFRGLGAIVEDVRMEPAPGSITTPRSSAPRASCSPSTSTICAPAPAISARTSSAASLTAVLIRGSDYVQAQRERRRLIAAMAPIYARYDVLVTRRPRPGAAARCLAHHHVLAEGLLHDALQRDQAARRWRSASASPTQGLPMSMQVVGRPFARCDGACASPTPTRRRRPGGTTAPRLDPHASFSTALPPVPDPEKADISQAKRDEIALICRRAGLTLNERQFELLCGPVPYLEAMLARLRKDRSFYEEPASIFRFPDLD